MVFNNDPDTKCWPARLHDVGQGHVDEIQAGVAMSTRTAMGFCGSFRHAIAHDMYAHVCAMPQALAHIKQQTLVRNEVCAHHRVAKPFLEV